MKRIIMSVAFLTSAFLLSQSAYNEAVSYSEIPEDVQKILVSSCYDCHSTDAGSKDAREALDFEKWNDYRTSKKIGLLGDICKLVEQEKMPPSKYLKNKPDREPDGEQKALICKWTKEEMEKLMQGD
jgi:hypothetical protein